MESVLKNITIAPQVQSTDDPVIAKIVAMCILGIGSFLVGILPIKVHRFIKVKSVEDDKNIVISLLLCFGGGVLLFTTFIHLQPEVRESIMNLEARKKIPTIGNGISIAELVFCLGFFVVYLIEELVHVFLERKLNDDTLHRSLSFRYNNKNKENGHHNQQQQTIPRVSLQSKLDDGTISYISNSNKELLDVSQTTINQQGHSHSHIDPTLKNSFSGLLAVLALSFHAVFEGLAVGLEGSMQKVWYLFAAIATHKLVIGFCVGIELVASKTKTTLVFVYITTFALVTPLGIGIGIILSETGGSGEDVTAVVLQGMAAGTLIYVVFFEVLARERSNHHSGIWQLLAILVGFGVMFALQILTGHEHSHQHGIHHPADHNETHEEHASHT